jgi:hypothetical protein
LDPPLTYRASVSLTYSLHVGSGTFDVVDEVTAVGEKARDVHERQAVCNVLPTIDVLMQAVVAERHLLPFQGELEANLRFRVDTAAQLSICNGRL